MNPAGFYNIELPIEDSLRWSSSNPVNSPYVTSTVGGKRLYSCKDHTANPSDFSSERKAALKDLPKMFMEKLDFICYIEA